MGKNRRWFNIVIVLMLALSMISPMAAQASGSGDTYAPASSVASASVTEATYQVELAVNGLSGPILASAIHTATEGTTALELVKSALEESSISYDVVNSEYGAYIKAINGLEAGSWGGWDGWMYSVNGVSPDVGLGAYELNDADKVEVYYSTYPIFSTTSVLEETTENPTVTVDLVGDAFTEQAELLNNWSIDVGDTALTVKEITRASNQQAVIAFEGTAQPGSIAISALSPAFLGKGTASLVADVKEKQVSVTVDIRVEGYKGTVLTLKDFEATALSKVTATDVTLQALDAGAIPYDDGAGSGYFRSINGEEEKALSEYSGWVYKVNGVYPNEYSPSYEIKNGDEIVWHYTNYWSIIESEYHGMFIGSGVDTVDKLTFEPIIDMPSEATAGEGLKIKVTGKYDIFDFGYNLKQSDLNANLDRVTIEMNGKKYVTDENGEVEIPAEDMNAGTFELRFSKDLPGTMIVMGETKEIESYPRIIRTYKELTINKPEAVIRREKVEQALEKGKAYLLDQKSNVSNRVNGLHSGYWMLSAMYAAGVDISKYPWTTAPTSADTHWMKALVEPTNDSNKDAGTIIGSVILGLDPTNVKSRNIVEDLVVKQRANGTFSTVWGESWALIALDLVNAEYNQAAQINAILKMQNATTGFFGFGEDLDATGWILIALAPHRDQPEVDAVIQKAVASYHQYFITKGFTDNANSMAAIISGLASVGEDLFSDKWTYEKDGEKINIVSYLAEKYQLENGGIRWKAAQTTSDLMALEQVYIAFSDALHQKSTFERVKENIENPGTDPGEGNGGENPGTDPGEGENPGPGPGTNPGEGGNPGNGNGNGGGSEENQAVSAYVSIQAGSSTFLASTKVEVPANGSAYDALLKAANANGITVQAKMTSLGVYVEGINGLMEKDRGPLSGWMYRVNGEFPGYSMDTYTVKDGDRIELVYTEDLGNDVGGGSPSINDSTIVIDSKDGEWSVQVAAEAIEQKLKEDPNGTLVIEDKTGTKVELPAASLSGAANVAVTIKNKDNGISVLIEQENAEGQQLSYSAGKGYVKVTIPVSDLAADTVVLAIINGEHRAVPHKIEGDSIVLYTKTSGQYVISTAKPTFDDLDGTDNRNEIEYLAARQVIKGMDDESFNPSGEITRGQFAAMISRALGLQAEGEGTFTDTAGKWYDLEIQALLEAGIINGTSATTFDPDAAISRQQAAALMARVLAYISYDGGAVSETAYSDADSIRPEFIEAIHLLQALDIMTGKSDGSFDPDGKLTRAQMAKILKRTLNISGLM